LAAPFLSNLLTPSDTAFHRFYFDFVIPIDEQPNSRGSTTTGSYFAFVPDIYGNAQADSCVALALSAAAHANFAKRCGSSASREQSHKDYGNTLKRIRDTVNANSAVSTDLLCSICLLAVYELCGDPVAAGSSWRAHALGLALLLKTMLESQAQILETAGLLQTIMTKMLIASITQGTPPPISRDVYHSLLPSFGLSTSMMDCMHQISDLQASWRAAQESSITDVQRAVADEIVKTGQALDEGLNIWSDTLAAGIGIRRIKNCDKNVPIWLRPLYSIQGAPPMLQEYADLHVCHRLQFLRASRLSLLTTLESAMYKLRSILDAEEQLRPLQNRLSSVQETIMMLIDDICEGTFAAFTVAVIGKSEPASFADVLGVRGYQLLWPLQSAATYLRQSIVRQPTVSTKLNWVNSTLICIRNHLGLQTGYLDRIALIA
jgi:hypothetical protein